MVRARRKRHILEAFSWSKHPPAQSSMLNSNNKKDFLQDYRCVLKTSLIPTSPGECAIGSILDVVNMAIAKLLSRRSPATSHLSHRHLNVLARGYKLADSPATFNFWRNGGLEATEGNPWIVGCFVEDAQWTQLLHAVGDGAMMQLLMHSDLYFDTDGKTENKPKSRQGKSFVQLTGKPYFKQPHKTKSSFPKNSAKALLVERTGMLYGQTHNHPFAKWLRMPLKDFTQHLFYSHNDDGAVVNARSKRYRKCRSHAKYIHKKLKRIPFVRGILDFYCPQISCLQAQRPDCVARYARSCLCKLVPPELRHKNQMLLESMAESMALLPRRDPIDLRRHHPTQHQASFLVWLVRGFLVPLLRASFYITEHSGNQDQLLFYRHPDWTAGTAPFVKTLLASTFERVPYDCQGMPGVFPMRLLPKLKQTHQGDDKNALRRVCSGVRPIVNLNRPVTPRHGINHHSSSCSSVRVQPANAVLRDAFDVLSYFRTQRSSLMGHSVMDRREAIRRYFHFSKNTKKANNHDNVNNENVDVDCLWMATADIASCYDSIPHAKLMQVLEELLAPYVHCGFSIKTFEVRRSPATFSNAKNGENRKNRKNGENSKKGKNRNGLIRMGRCVRWAMPGQGCTSQELLTRMKSYNSHQGGMTTILTDRIHQRHIPVSAILSTIRKHITQHYVHLKTPCPTTNYDDDGDNDDDDKTTEHNHRRPVFAVYRQRVGIPQGSVLSSLLCALFYAHMDRTCLAHLVDNPLMLCMRYTDDFLVASPCKRLVERFLEEVVEQGVLEYGVHFHSHKVSHNLRTENTVVRWIGFELNGKDDNAASAILPDNMNGSLSSVSMKAWVRGPTRQGLQIILARWLLPHLILLKQVDSARKGNSRKTNPSKATQQRLTQWLLMKCLALVRAVRQHSPNTLRSLLRAMPGAIRTVLHENLCIT